MPDGTCTEGKIEPQHTCTHRLIISLIISKGQLEASLISAAA